MEPLYIFPVQGGKVMYCIFVVCNAIQVNCSRNAFGLRITFQDHVSGSRFSRLSFYLVKESNQKNLLLKSIIF